MILPIVPVITGIDIDSVAGQLATGYINDGRRVADLECEISTYHGAYCVCMSSCTVALEVIIRYYGFKEITIPRVSQISTVHACINAGVRQIVCSGAPVLQADLSGRIAGSGIISDAAQSILTRGIIRHRFACAFSLGALKNITGGTGGGILTNDRQLFFCAKEVKNYGKSITAKSDSDISRVGSNYRMSDINATLALSQWQRRNEVITKKWHIWAEYRRLLGDVIWDREDDEVPWVVEANVARWPAVECFRRYYLPFGKYPHLATHISNWRQTQDEIEAVMLPSSLDLSDNDIARYSKFFQESYS